MASDDLKPDRRIDVDAFEFSIVVVGVMNPAIHHPYWYESREILGEDDVKAALEKAVVCTPDFSEFETDKMHITCRRDRWICLTTLNEHEEHVVAISQAVFKVLFDTPIDAWGINTDQHTKTSSEAVGNELAALISKSARALTNLEKANAQFEYSYEDGAVVHNVKVRHSLKSDQHVSVYLNTHHAVPSPKKGTHFDLSDLIATDLGTHTTLREKIISEAVSLFRNG